MSATRLERFQSTVDAFDSFVHSLSDTSGVKEKRERMQEMPPKVVSGINCLNIRKINIRQFELIRIVNEATDNELYWSEDLRATWLSTLGELNWISQLTVSRIEKALMCFEAKVTIMPLLSVDFASDFNMEGISPKDNELTAKTTLKGKQPVKPRPVRRSAAKVKEMVVEDEGGKQDVGPPFNAAKHVMNDPKVCPNVRKSQALC